MPIMPMPFSTHFSQSFMSARMSQSGFSPAQSPARTQTPFSTTNTPRGSSSSLKPQVMMELKPMSASLPLTSGSLFQASLSSFIQSAENRLAMILMSSIVG